VQEITKHKAFDSVFFEIRKTAGLLWERGWAEANAGNFSVNVTDICRSEKLSFSGRRIKTLRKYEYLKNSFILISRSGSRMRDIALNPLPDICIIYIDKSADHYYNVKIDNISDKKPSSEVTAHLEIHNRLLKNKQEEKVVLHTHPAELIALTNLKKYTNEKNLNKLFYSVQPEMSVLFPEGIGFVPYILTGSEKLATQTGKKFKYKKIVLWEKHGCVSAGNNFDSAFDNIDVLVKSAKIFFLAVSAGNKAKGLNVYQIKELKKLNNK
jgi:rhamnulose-1-phosphate aldolase